MISKRKFDRALRRFKKNQKIIADYLLEQENIKKAQEQVKNEDK